jgi:hypothetical protein
MFDRKTRSKSKQSGKTNETSQLNSSISIDDSKPLHSCSKKALLSTTKHTQVRSNTRIEVQIQVISKTTPQHPHGT